MKKKKNILFIVSRVPVNLKTGDRIRVYHLIKELTERGHQVDIIGYVPANDFTFNTNIEALCSKCIFVEKKDIEFKNPSRIRQMITFCRSFASGYPFRVWQWYHKSFINKAAKLIEEKKYDIIHFSEVVTGLVFDKVIKTDCSAKLVIDLIDSVAMSIDSSIEQSAFLRPFRFIEKKRLKKYEQNLIKRADEVILISERDKNIWAVMMFPLFQTVFQ